MNIIKAISPSRVSQKKKQIHASSFQPESLFDLPFCLSTSLRNIGLFIQKVKKMGQGVILLRTQYGNNCSIFRNGKIMLHYSGMELRYDATRIVGLQSSVRHMSVYGPKKTIALTT